MPMSLRALNRPRLLRALAAVLLGLLGGWVGLMLGGTVHHEIGPLNTSMRVLPTWGGGTTVSIPPLGELVLDTHAGPLGLDVELTGVDIEEAREIMADPSSLSDLPQQAEKDLRWELLMAAGRSLTAAVVGGALLSALALRRVTSALVGGAGAAVAMVTAALLALTSQNPAALAEPRYTGLLASAPTVVGDAGQIVEDFNRYGDQLARLVGNVTGLYAATSSLPILPPDRDVVRVMHVSDLHLAPQAWDVMRTVANNYEVDVVVDSGDITDHGSIPENRYVREIGNMKVPYVWVRGNHDSLDTQKAVARVPNATVLDGNVRRVAGLTFAGVGDPTFTPDKRTSMDDDAMAGHVAVAADRLARVAEEAGGVDVAVFHDPEPVDVVDGLASVALSGHRHYRKVEQGEAGTWFMMQGSTGGSGLRALEPKKPSKIELSVLYLDRESGELLAYDDVSLGGLGLASAEIDRQLVKPIDEESGLVAPEPEDRRSRESEDRRSPETEESPSPSGRP